ncbi:MAG: hypothetical protein K6T99_11740 [Armatimonadetes bacterium]|nr:hypothetical protein [Armatimonadota bacterium]
MNPLTSEPASWLEQQQEGEDKHGRACRSASAICADAGAYCDSVRTADYAERSGRGSGHRSAYRGDLALGNRRAVTDYSSVSRGLKARFKSIISTAITSFGYR